MLAGFYAWLSGQSIVLRLWFRYPTLKTYLLSNQPMQLISVSKT